MKNNNTTNSKASDSGNFLVQGSILAAAGILVRLIGLIYKVPMTRILGREGIGYYNTAYEIYNIGLILSSYSLPLAISKLIAARRIRGQYQDARRVYLCGMAFGVTVGTIMTGLLLLGSSWITSTIFKSPGSALPLAVMAPTVLIFSIMGIIRGYFQGFGNMIPTSVSQIIEQVVHAAVSIAASYLFLRWFSGTANPAAYGAAGGTLGTLTGALAALIFLSASMLRHKKAQAPLYSQPQSVPAESWKSVFKALIITLTPIILSQFVYQLSGSVDNSLFGQIMAAKGLSEKERMSLLGVYGGEYRLLTNVPVAIASSLGTSMIPSIVASKTQGDFPAVQKKIRLTVKFNMLIAIPCAVGMGVLAGPVMKLIFGDSSSLARDLLTMGAPAVIFFSLSTVTNAVLQGIDLMRKSVTHSAISLALHTILVYVLLHHFNMGVYGLVIGNVTFALVVCVLNWIAIGKALKYHQEVKNTFLMPLISAGIMGAAAFGIYKLTASITGYYQLGILLCVPAAMVIYGVLIILTGAVTKEELPDMPFGMRILRLCKKAGLIR